VTVSWSTASEVNNDYFILEHSVNGTDWLIIKYVTGQGNSTTIVKYKLIHSAPSNGINYYRITQVDFDGVFETFNILMCRVSSNIVKEIKMYNYIGEEILKPNSGHYIIRTYYTDGSVKIDKICIIVPN
jgi:hypothetical protein